MVKNIKTIYIDSLLLAEAQARGINFSQTVESLLRQLFNMDEKKALGIHDREKALAELADAKARLAAVEQALEKEKTRKKEFWE